MYALPDDKDDYILVIHSINFNEVWTQGIYEAINKTFTQEHITVLGEELSIPAIKDTTDVNEKLEILEKKYQISSMYRRKGKVYVRILLKSGEKRPEKAVDVYPDLEDVYLYYFNGSEE